MFEEIFTKEFNLSFKRPRSDTCKICDMHTARGSKDSEEYLAHRADFTLATAARQADERRARSTGEIVCLAVDLEKALPCPHISTGEVYYLRQLWCYNCGIHVHNDGSAAMCMWSEHIAGRGADEIASCMLQFFENRSFDTDELVLWTDSCAGQNKNKFIVGFLFLLLGLGIFSVIRQKFPPVGHTQCRCDQDFGIIEKRSRLAVNKLILPDDWRKLVESARTTPFPFQVLEMTKDNVFDFHAFSKNFTFRAKGSDGESVRYTQFREIKVDRRRHFELSYKYSFEEKEKWKTVSYRKNARSKLLDLRDVELKPKFTGEKPIKYKKYKDLQVVSFIMGRAVDLSFLLCLQKLLKYIPESAHEFYKTLPHDGVTPEETKEDTNVEEAE